MLKKFAVVLGLGWFAALGFSACTEEVSEGPEVQLPPREHTWVRTETVKKTKEDFFSSKDETPEAIPIDPDLKSRLSTLDSTKVSGEVTDTDTCLERLKPLDRMRTAVQKEGGMWHTFERWPEVRPHSDQGMQLDSHLNQLVFAIRHLCQTAKGLPMDNIARFVSSKVAEKGKEATREELHKLGNAKGDVEIWLEHAEYRLKNQKRDLDYQFIERLIWEAEPLVSFYRELSRQEPGAVPEKQFLTQAVTLLDIVTGKLANEHYLVLALREDKEIPFENMSTDL